MDTSARSVETEPADAAERLTWEEICARYPNEHVLLVDCEWPDGNIDNDFRTAVVLAHGPDRDKTLSHMDPGDDRYEEFVLEYTGAMRLPLLPLWLFHQ